MASRRQPRMLEAGARAPDFELEELGGGRRTLRSIAKSGPVVLAFFKVSCPTCQFAFPFLERLGRGSTPIWTVSQNDAEETREFHAEYGITLPTLLDSEDSGYPASNAYGLSYVPSLFLIEEDGRIGWTDTGFRKAGLEELGRKVGIAPFQPGEYVPEWKSG